MGIGVMGGMVSATLLAIFFRTGVLSGDPPLLLKDKSET
ncbi:hypothetical protein ACLBOM_05795 [Escherichia coli]